MMTVDELNCYIKHYLEEDKTKTAIMLTGEWGSGKTYYVENVLVPFLQEQKKRAAVSGWETGSLLSGERKKTDGNNLLNIIPGR